MNTRSRLIELEEAVRSLNSGGVVVFPTDTLYGLGADVFSLAALQRIFSIKGRRADLALPVLVAGLDQVEAVAQPMSAQAQRLAERFWPGPLTLVMRRSPDLPGLVTGGADTVAVRMPGHPVPLELARRLGRPITGTSANRSGQPDLLDLSALENQLGNLVDHIIQTGPVPAGTASTIVNVTGDTPQLLRGGAISLEEILEAAG
ncbi:MAG: L-threonylcarbamoyladenylate synthase [Chloroflexota bacterium]|nr:L-threonylcarbamoyladenylate synthase [Chloroflexota bacterium]